MLIRLKNKLDFTVSDDEISNLVGNRIVTDRVQEVLDTLDDAYGSSRSSIDMGGYVYLITDEKTYDLHIEELLAVYNVSSDMFEFSDTLTSEEKRVWNEELYLLDSEDSITVIHPVER